METVKKKTENGKEIISLVGRIDSMNAGEVEQEIRELRKGASEKPIVMDCDQLDYVSSAGLRIFLRLHKEDGVVLVNVHPDLYEILDMTGFTEILEVRKAYRVLSVEGCEIIGQGAKSKVYRVLEDTVVKVYRDPDSLSEIQESRELSRKAFVAGVPTAIPYDVVLIKEGGFGSVFELLDTDCLSKLLREGEKTVDEVAEISVDLLKVIHSKTAKPGSMPDRKKVVLGWTKFLKDHLPEDQYHRLHTLVDEIPDDLHLVHGDYQVNNIMFQNGESLLIDLDTLSCGDPVLELGTMYASYVGNGRVDPAGTRAFFGLPYETCTQLWRKILELYLGTTDPDQMNAVEEKVKIVGLIRVLHHFIRHGGMDTESGRQGIASCKEELADLIARVDSLALGRA